MPWDAAESKRHTKKADSPKARKQWKEVANSVLKRTGNESRAIKSANAVIARRKYGLDSM